MQAHLRLDAFLCVTCQRVWWHAGSPFLFCWKRLSGVCVWPKFFLWRFLRRMDVVYRPPSGQNEETKRQMEGQCSRCAEINDGGYARASLYRRVVVVVVVLVVVDGEKEKARRCETRSAWKAKEYETHEHTNAYTHTRFNTRRHKHANKRSKAEEAISPRKGKTEEGERERRNMIERARKRSAARC